MSATLQISKRELGADLNKMREQKRIPGVLYGFGIESSPIVFDYNLFAKAYLEAGESTLVNLDLEGKEHKVLIKDVQHDPVSDLVSHVDFYVVNLSKPIEASIQLRFIGEAPAVKSLGGTLVTPTSKLHVRALPEKLIKFIDVPLANLLTFNDSIRAKDIVLPEGIELVEYTGRTIAIVSAPREEEIEQAPEAAAVAAEGQPAAEAEKSSAEGKEEKKKPDDKKKAKE
ncbi:MAG: hypothetical protein ACD_76C00161G0002 [uncultured bacterium]|nr:MAG: hypothetical protein ACD_76C00161G0002 [uncultured bacterium]HBD05414.1 50S ribosomal protein L25 [Candidatus Uhrbacteria bacterium]